MDSSAGGSSSNRNRKRQSTAGYSPRVHKIPKVDHQEEDPVKLQNMNKALAVNIAEKNQKIKFLKRKCQALFRSRGIADSSYKCIRRHWLQLLNDLKLLLENLGASDSMETESCDILSSILRKTNPFASLDANEGIILNMPEWFLLEKIEDDNEEEHAEESEIPMPTQVEQSIQDDCSLATTMLSSVVTAIRNSKMYNLSSTDDIQKLNGVQDQVIEKNRQLLMEILSLKDIVDAVKKHNADLERDLEQKEKHRHRAIRELERYRNDTDGRGGEAEGKKQSIEQQEESGQNESKNGTTDPQGLDSNVQNQNSDQANENIAALEEKCAKFEEQLQQQISKNEEQLKDETSKREIERLNEEVQYQQSEVYRIQKTVETLRSNCEIYMNERLATLSSSETKQYQLDLEWVEKFKQCQQETTDSQNMTNDLQMQLHRATAELQAQGSYKSQCEEYATLCQGLRSEQESLKKQLLRAEENGKRAQKHKMQAYVDGVTVKVKSLEEEKMELLATIHTFKDSILGSLTSLENKNGENGDAANTENPPSVEDQLKASLEIYTEQTKTLEDIRSRLQRRDLTIARLVEDMKEAKEKSEAATSEVDGLIGEIEAISKELENLQSQNTNLLTSNKTLLEENMTLASEHSQLAKSRALLGEEMGGLRAKMTTAEIAIGKAAELNNKLQETQNATLVENKQLLDKCQFLAHEMEGLRQALRRARNDIIVVKQQTEDEVKARPCEACLRHEKAEEERKEKIKQARESGNHSTDDPMTELERLELKNLRKLVKCSVCQDRQKDVIITKCNHMFCKECIDNNLKARNRKCPTCKKMYGQDDVSLVWVV